MGGIGSLGGGFGSTGRGGAFAGCKGNGLKESI